MKSSTFFFLFKICANIKKKKKMCGFTETYRLNYFLAGNTPTFNSLCLLPGKNCSWPENNLTKVDIRPNCQLVKTVFILSLTASTPNSFQGRGDLVFPRQSLETNISA